MDAKAFSAHIWSFQGRMNTKGELTQQEKVHSSATELKTSGKIMKVQKN